MKPRLLVFFQQTLNLIPPVLAYEYIVLRNGVSFGSDAPVAQLLYRSVFRIYDALQYVSVGGPVHVPDDGNYAQPLRFAGGIAQLILPIVGICFAVLLAALIRTILPEKISRAILHPWIGATGVLAWFIFQWRMSPIVPASTSVLAFEPAWLEAGRVVEAFFFCVLLVSATAMVYVGIRSKQMTYLGAAVFSLFWILHFGFSFVPWVIVPYLIYFTLHLVSLLAAILGLIWLFKVGQIRQDQLQSRDSRIGG